MESLPINKMDTRLRNLSPWRKGWEGGENKDNLGWTKQTSLRKTRIGLAQIERIGLTWREARRLRRTDTWSCECWNDRMHLKRSTPVGKELTGQPEWSRRISTPIEIWEHCLEKVWINTWLRSNSNTTNKTKQRIGLQNKPEQIHMIEIYPIPYHASVGKIF